MCGYATQKVCKGAVNPPVGRCVIALCESRSCFSSFRQMRGPQRARRKAKWAVGEVYQVPQVETSPGLFRGCAANREAEGQNTRLEAGCFQEDLWAAALTILIVTFEFEDVSVTFWLSLVFVFYVDPIVLKLCCKAAPPQDITTNCGLWSDSFRDSWKNVRTNC